MCWWGELRDRRVSTRVLVRIIEHVQTVALVLAILEIERS
jgi:hypothetical protein